MFPASMTYNLTCIHNPMQNLDYHQCYQAMGYYNNIGTISRWNVPSCGPGNNIHNVKLIWKRLVTIRWFICGGEKNIQNNWPHTISKDIYLLFKFQTHLSVTGQHGYNLVHSPLVLHITKYYTWAFAIQTRIPDSTLSTVRTCGPQLN